MERVTFMVCVIMVQIMILLMIVHIISLFLEPLMVDPYHLDLSQTSALLNSAIEKAQSA